MCCSRRTLWTLQNLVCSCDLLDIFPVILKHLPNVLQLKNAPDLTKVPVHGPSYKEKGSSREGQEQQQIEATKTYSEVGHALLQLT